jgi:hypothetical protein
MSTPQPAPEQKVRQRITVAAFSNGACSRSPGLRFYLFLLREMRWKGTLVSLSICPGWLKADKYKTLPSWVKAAPDTNGIGTSAIGRPISPAQRN